MTWTPYSSINLLVHIVKSKSSNPTQYRWAFFAIPVLPPIIDVTLVLCSEVVGLFSGIVVKRLGFKFILLSGVALSIVPIFIPFPVNWLLLIPISKSASSNR